MDSDRELADLLGGPPGDPDPAFRFDVYARVTERARRRAAFDRAVRSMLVFAGIGLAVPVAQVALSAMHPDFAAVQALFIAAGAVALTSLLAAAAIRGPSVLRSLTRSALRVRIWPA